jgi:hypothetical protein
MKDAELIKEALRILGDGARKAGAVQNIRYNMQAVQRQKNYKSSGDYGTLTKPQKTAARRLAAALRRVEVAAKNPNLAFDAQLIFSFDVEGFELMRRAAEAIAYQKLAPPSPADGAKSYAAKAAARLLLKHGLPLNVTRGGKFCRLAALLYGDPKADLFRQCRATAKAARAEPNRV